MSWDKVGKLLVAVLLGLMVLLAAYGLLRGNPRLEASLTYAYLTYPSQFSERITKASEQLKYEQLQGRINAISEGGLSHDQVERLIEMAQAPYAQLFAKPFEAGLVDHRTGLLIELRNRGDAQVRQVKIRLPAKGLVQVRDAAGNDTIVETSTMQADIPTIEPGGVCKVWVYFDADYSQIRQGGVSISHADGNADIQVYREVIGIPAWVARYSRELMMLLGVLAASVLGLGYACLSRRRVA
ncbi:MULTISPECIES: hypothetical protein [Pseudomonas]|uniref:Uncharacterized protein n=2 Tax=Pseudomonas TaxID=286 RepID=A0A0B5KFE4_PSEDL|nr:MULTISPECIES: hypothetical protein [Pseudomonas]AHZ76839.1 hypothetical protein DW66_2325 [Pseudomonas putida]AJG14291.1 hypothetical protein RK21_02783 [Pseudomonas plecoglossicida]ESW37848.1 hypothetical protein O164_21405 [Pseudomonas taiwanensis SJ9]MBF8791150.1 hypothetical protein [Pseudomonas asiatica]MBO2893416.1 hypothetical protein [Pseudomonas asiatica]